jgi:hypothetical protein
MGQPNFMAGVTETLNATRDAGRAIWEIETAE